MKMGKKMNKGASKCFRNDFKEAFWFLVFLNEASELMVTVQDKDKSILPDWDQIIYDFCDIRTFFC